MICNSLTSTNADNWNNIVGILFDLETPLCSCVGGNGMKMSLPGSSVVSSTASFDGWANIQHDDEKTFHAILSKSED